jgi:hypothetical protein
MQFARRLISSFSKSLLLSSLAKSCGMISDFDLGEEDAMRITRLTIVAFCAAASVVLGVAGKAQSRPVCSPGVTASLGTQRDTLVKEPKVQSKVVGFCRSPARSRDTLPTCSSGPYVNCKGTCSDGAEWFSWQCCIGKDDFPPACSLNCDKEFAGCIAQ